MHPSTDFLGHVDVVPPLTASERDKLLELIAVTAAAAPEDACRWVPCVDGDCLLVDGDATLGGLAEWLRLIVKQVLAPAGRVADGTVVGYRRTDRELGVVEVRANRVTRRLLRPGGPAPAAAHRAAAVARRRRRAVVVDLDSRRRTT